ncbi:WD40-like Beta Propeller Repeat [Clostridium collagenovorans DSM 3089]|uniref:WD40-like Beta Propeller Repeat n=1 Tax=Clostridium collagenovorans DSM 3089 TaxID=1121306 RepID=A0A1M5X3G3_9CLOT|nr:PD40 domain-containing protein [Clostridium collagenovorans]SHH94331.1 WD40-like Beta Propeller Repeat [Clostridium collagenovorans DSM 3089]
MGNIINKINESLRRFPEIRKFAKGIYQVIGWSLSDKKTENSNIICISDSRYEHLFGYYDKSPWNKECTKMIYLRTENANREVAPSKQALIILKDLEKNEETIIGSTYAWNVQQGCMLQWLGPEMNKKIIYNDFRNGEFCSVILDIETGTEKVLPIAVYSVDKNGEYALSLDFSRLHNLRPGYGYSNTNKDTVDEKCPNSTCIWRMNINTGEVKGLLTYKQLMDFESREEMNGAIHKVNHIMINPEGKRFMVLHRWIKNGKKYTRLLTVDIDGENVYNLMDEDMISHCNWKNNREILAWAHTHSHGNKYYLLTDQTQKREIFAEGILNRDGHPSYSPDNKYVITDTYPNFKCKQNLYLCSADGENVKEIAEVYSSLRYNNENRCDLHPRFSPDGRYICFDGAINKLRQVYVLKVFD